MIKITKTNNLFLKVLLIFLLVTNSLSILFSGKLVQTVYDPYNRVVNNPFDNTYTSSVMEIPGNDAGPSISLFSDFVFNYGGEENIIVKEPYCRYGGQYFYNIYNDPRPGANIFTSNYSLYYCKTTLDLINKIEIPDSWRDSDLVMYCNDGNAINFKNQNLDFLTSMVSSIYKLCIIKNLDLKSENTIVYGFLVGNLNVDSDNIINKNSLKELFDNSNLFVSLDKDYFTIKEFNSSLNLGLSNKSSLIKSSSDFGISRVALYRQYKNSSREILGIESSSGFIEIGQTNSNKIMKPIYKIKFSDNWGNIEDVCMRTLAYYNPIKSFNYPSTTQKIICSTNKIIINSNAIDGDEYADNSLNLFKNIILNLN